MMNISETKIVAAPLCRGAHPAAERRGHNSRQ